MTREPVPRCERCNKPIEPQRARGPKLPRFCADCFWKDKAMRSANARVGGLANARKVRRP